MNMCPCIFLSVFSYTCYSFAMPDYSVLCSIFDTYWRLNYVGHFSCTTSDFHYCSMQLHSETVPSCIFIFIYINKYMCLFGGIFYVRQYSISNRQFRFCIGITNWLIHILKCALLVFFYFLNAFCFENPLNTLCCL